MATRLKTKTKKRTKKADLEMEARLLRSAVIGLIGVDSEGEYRPEFVTKVLAASKEKPTHAFTSPQGFLRELKRV